ncbi:hypothetical protein [Streptomyces luteolus]|uniref:Integral membrane protein n=1 Tax=Streptomyces luteolus TaxID=3043615 RepID=A0ABT6T861_9ACTN|nr:hypothetical protein [Streptomyces sp. B-S-A12]MDI3424078.1 hypothetical protein [Streptomyces sp. B-S-A12]
MKGRARSAGKRQVEQRHEGSDGFVAVLLLAVWVVWNGWSFLGLVSGLGRGVWRGAMWWMCLCCVALFAAWLRGLFSGGLDTKEACRSVRHRPCGGAYWEARAEQFGKFFPLHSMCNEHYGMVPAWVNPTAVTCVVVALISAAVVLWFGIARLIGTPGKGNPART